jgi:hypothetical protein
MKSGANQQDINTIKEFAAAGKTAEEIANFLDLPLSCVESFMGVESSEPSPSDNVVDDPFAGIPGIET